MAKAFVVNDFEPKSEETEAQFCSFYIDALKKLCSDSRRKFVTEARQCLKTIRSYKNLDIECHETVSFKEKTYRVAYIFAYGIIHSTVVYNRFAGMLRNIPTMFKSIISAKKIRLCILGGGPGIEAISLCKLLNNILVKYRSKECSPLHLDITIIDECLGWKEDTETIIKLMEGDFYNANYVNMSLNFIEADLTEKFSVEVKAAIAKANIVTMVKFISDVNEATSSNAKVKKMIIRIIENMNPKSCIFYLDSAGGGVFKAMDIMITKLPETTRMYGPCLFIKHMLNIDTIEKFTSELQHIFGFYKCTQQITISYSAWAKNSDIIPLNQLHLSTIPVQDIKYNESREHAIEKRLKKSAKRHLKNMPSHELNKICV